MKWIRTTANKISGGHTRYVVKSGSWLMLERMVTLLVALGVSVAFANLIPKDVYGNYKYLIAIGTILTAFSLTGFDGNVVRSVAKGYEGAFLSSVRLYFTWCWGIIVTGIALTLYYFFAQNSGLSGAILIIALTTPLIQGFIMYRSYLYGKQLFSYVSKLNIVYACIPNAVLVTGMLFSQNIIVLIGLFFASSTLVLCAQFFLVLKRYRPNTHTDPHTWQLGKHMSIMNAFALFTGKLDSILLFQFAGSTQLATYSFAVAMPEMIRGSFKLLQTIALPKIVKSTSTNLKKSILVKTAYFFVISGTISVAYILAAPYIFSLLFEQYSESVLYSQVFAITIMLNALFAASFFESKIAIKHRYALNIFANASSIITLIPFTYFYGIWGTIASRILSRFLNAVFSIALLYTYKENTVDKT